MTRPPHRTAGGGGGFDRRLALLVAGGLFMEILDSTVIAPAAPAIAADLGVAAVDVNVAITAYVLTLGVLVPISGWLADRFGARRIFLTAILTFTLASVGCALATTLPLLTATRILQGAGGAMMVPVGRLVVLRSTPKPDLVRAVAYLTWPALSAPLVAPALGGVLSTYASWRFIFVLNLPLGVLGAVLARRLVPDVRAREARALDWRGFALTAGGVAALSVGLEAVGAQQPSWGVVLTGLGAAAVLLTGAVAYLLRAHQPLLDLRVLGIATYRVTAFGGSVFRAVILGVPFLVPVFLQVGFGWSAAEAGLVMIALFAGNIGIKPVTTPLLRWFGFKAVMLAAVVASAGALAGIAWVSTDTPVPLLVGLLAASGIFRSIGFTTYNTVAFVDVEAPRMTSANTLLSTLQELGAGLGVAVAALLVRLGEPVTAAVGRTGSDAPFRFAFLALALVLMVPALEAIRLPRSAGDVATGRT